MRASTRISVKEKRAFTLSGFRGVDFSSAPLQVSAHRAADAANWICDCGRLQKRHGWRQITDALDGRINGIFPYRNGSAQELLVYAGCVFYRLYQTDGEWKVKRLEVRGLGDAELTDTRCQAFYNDGSLYLIGCGSFLKYVKYVSGGWMLMRVSAMDPYIPTTSVSINALAESDGVRATLDPVNLLTPKRKNKLLGYGGQLQNVWQLDASVARNTTVTVELERASDSILGATYTVTFSNTNDADRTRLYDEYGTEVGSIRFSEGLLTLATDTTPPVGGRDNLTVTFTKGADYTFETDDSRLERIEGCRFGTLFGVGGNADRLFLSGNPRHPNAVYFSEMNDFTYFPDQFTAAMGTDRTAVTGFLRLSDKTLAIFKEREDDAPSIYYQSGEYRSFYDTDGNLQKITPVFGITAGAAAESAVNAHTAATLAGDHLILSQNGVFGVETVQNVATDARVVRERSRAVNARLTRQPSLSDAVGIVYRGRYYLSMDGVCYVADSRYKYQPEDCAYYNYEWWYWENVPARVFAIVEDALWFGTADGRLCCFDEAWTDRTFSFTAVGELGVEMSSGRMLYAPTLDPSLAEGVCAELCNAGFYAAYVSVRAIAEGMRAVVSASDILRICTGETVYADGCGTSDLRVGVPYLVSDIDPVTCSFALTDRSGNEMRLAGVTTAFALYRPLTGCKLYVCDMDTEERRFGLALYPGGEALRLVDYRGSAMPTNPVARLWRTENVRARWCTPVFDCGTNECSKTLLKLTLAAEPGNGDHVTFGYETRMSSRAFALEGNGRFSFADLAFSAFSFESGFQNSCSVNVKERNWNYIAFRFSSDGDGDCSIHELTAIYKINRRNVGVT